MVNVFVFLGEFGFELFNWQGVIRKLKTTLGPGERIVCCSRANLYLLYEMADAYVDISEVESFKNSRAFVYWAVPTREGVTDSIAALRFDRRLKRDIRAFVLDRLRRGGVLDEGDSHRFVFSSDHTLINGCEFGRSRGGPVRIALANVYRGLKSLVPAAERPIEAIKRQLFRHLFSPDFGGAGNIYEKLDLDNNVFRKIEPDLSVRGAVEEKLGWSLDEPYVLCQIRIRDTREISGDTLPPDEMERLFAALAERMKVVLLSFSTGRRFDSYSVFGRSPRCFEYSCGSFPEQACLIHFAARLVFFTEGDFGSHTYLPPLFGRDVTVIAPRSVYDILADSPVERERADALGFWNENVYRFGGQVIPKIAEEVFAGDDELRRLVGEILADEAAETPA